MTIEERLKDLILSKYKSIREFTNTIQIPYSTLDTILKRGIRNSNVDNVIKICESLNISADALANGDIIFKDDVQTIAAHHDGEEWTEEELEEIERFKAFVRSKRK